MRYVVAVIVAVEKCGSGGGMLWLLLLESNDAESVGDATFVGNGFVRYRPRYG